MNERPPAFQFYPKDFISDEHVITMSMAERGIYITLLSFCWLQGSIPNDEKVAARLCGASNEEIHEAWTSVSGRFYLDPQDPTRLRHKRLDVERERQRLWKEKSAEGGRNRAKHRATTLQPPFKDGCDLAEPNLKPRDEDGDGDGDGEAIAEVVLKEKIPLHENRLSVVPPQPIEVTQRSTPSIRHSCSDDSEMVAAGFTSPEEFSTWWEELVRKHPNHNKSTVARQRCIEAILSGRFQREEFDRGYGAMAAASQAQWARERGRFVPNLYQIFEDNLWRYEPPPDVPDTTRMSEMDRNFMKARVLR